MAILRVPLQTSFAEEIFVTVWDFASEGLFWSMERTPVSL